MSDADAQAGGSGGDTGRSPDDPPSPAADPDHPVGEKQAEKNEEDEPPA